MSAVKLVWVTPDADALIAKIARVSNPANEDSAATAPRLIRYLIRHRHWSPFEMASLCVEIYAPRDVGRQLLRHRSFSFQEFSQRYASVGEMPEAPMREARMQHHTNRQASIPCEFPGLRAEWKARQEGLRGVAEEAYFWALGAGIAKEVARAVLPEGLTMSRLYMAGTIRSWLHFCDLRRANGTQLETQEVAEGCWRVLREAAPATVEAWEGA